ATLKLNMYHVQGTGADPLCGRVFSIRRSEARLAFWVFISLFLTSFACFGQLCPPRIASQLELPETYYANISHHATSDGGFILAGTSYGFTDQDSPNYGAGDFLLLRLDSNLQKVWDQSFGGTNSEQLRLA